MSNEFTSLLIWSIEKTRIAWCTKLTKQADIITFQLYTSHLFRLRTGVADSDTSHQADLSWLIYNFIAAISFDPICNDSDWMSVLADSWPPRLRLRGREYLISGVMWGTASWAWDLGLITPTSLWCSDNRLTTIKVCTKEGETKDNFLKYKKLNYFVLPPPRHPLGPSEG